MKLTNWKTTLLGIIGAAGTVAWPLIQTGNVGIKDIAIAVVIAVFGYLTKDAGVTGTKI